MAKGRSGTAKPGYVYLGLSLAVYVVVVLFRKLVLHHGWAGSLYWNNLPFGLVLLATMYALSRIRPRE